MKQSIILLLAIFLVMFSCQYVFAQQENQLETGIEMPKNAFYLELFGSGLVYTLNYERVISDGLHLRIGAGFYGYALGNYGNREYSIPIIANKLFGKQNAKFELGAGIMFSNAFPEVVKDESFNAMESNIFWENFRLSATIGYRHQFKNNLLFRIGLNPSFSRNGAFMASPGISFGSGF